MFYEFKKLQTLIMKAACIVMLLLKSLKKWYSKFTSE